MNGKIEEFTGIKKMIPKCPHCNKPMINAIDKYTGEVSKYLWKCEEHNYLMLSLG